MWDQSKLHHHTQSNNNRNQQGLPPTSEWVLSRSRAWDISFSRSQKLSQAEARNDQHQQ